MKNKLGSFALALAIAMLLCACTSVRADVQEESSTSSSAVAYYADGNYSHFIQDIKKGKIDVPDGLLLLDEDLLRDTFGPNGPVNVYLPENWEDGFIKFNFGIDLYGEYTGLAESYELTEDQLMHGYMLEWPWNHWGNLATNLSFYEAAGTGGNVPDVADWTVPTPTPCPTPPLRQDGSLWQEVLSHMEYKEKPSPTPYRQPVEEYRPPEWRPVPEHEGYEMAIVAETDEGRPLAVRLRWQRDGHWFLCQIPGHCLNKFWEVADSLWVKMNLSDYSGCDEEQEPQRGID